MEDLEMKFRITEGQIEYPKDTSHMYNGRLAVAADRLDEAMISLIGHIKQ